MPKVWVLDTETKGTGAQVVPLERKRRTPEPEDAAIVVGRRPRPRPAPEPAPRAPSRFRVVDVMTREVLADDVGAREAVDLLEGTRSVVDVLVSLWDDAHDRWRLLSRSEQQALWDLRGRRAGA